MKTHEVMEVEFHAFRTSALDGAEWSTSHSGRFIPSVRAPGTHRIGGCVSPRAGLDDMAKRNNRIIAPARNQTPAVQPVA